MGRSRIFSSACAVIVVAACTQTVTAAEPELTLAQAERLAIEQDPAANAMLMRADALAYHGVADSQLPDPKLSLGLFNLPLDNFDLNDNPTTQLRAGVRQTFPRGDTLTLKRTLADAEATAIRASADNYLRSVTREVRETWLEIFYHSAAGQIIAQSRNLFEQLVDITESHYGGGRVTQQDVLQAQIELIRLDDRATQTLATEEQHRAQLAKWIGEAAHRPLSQTLPTLSPLPSRADLETSLEQHPLIIADSARIQGANDAINIARAQYKPEWSLGMEYRKRFGDNPDGSDRADMMAIMATVDLPLFTEKRQDQRVLASLRQADAAALTRDDSVRQLRATLEQEYSSVTRLSERQSLYQSGLLPNTVANADAALSAYQSGLSEFTAVMRARITAFNVRLESLRIEVDRAQSHARLLYLATGEDS